MNVKDLIDKYEKANRDYAGVTCYKEFLSDLKLLPTIEYSHKIKAPTEIAEYLVFCERHEYSLKLAIEMKTPQVAEIMEVIHTVSTRGDGTDDNPVRIVHQYWTKTGEMLAEKDCF